jgi:hypothetical protein
VSNDPLGLANIFTRAGVLATDASAVLGTAAAETDVAASAAILGQTAPGKKPPFQVVEPAPDNRAELGDELELVVFAEPLFQDDNPLPGHPVQGYVDNCPLVAVLVAMLHVPALRAAVRHGLVRERAHPFSTHRTRMTFEYKVGDPALDQPMRRLPGAKTNFEGTRVFDVTFFKNPQTFHIGPNGDILVHAIGPTAHQRATPVYYRLQNTGNSLNLYYAHSMRRELYPAAIEKAYVHHHSPANLPNYQTINVGLPLADVMFELAGYARQGWIAQSPTDEDEDDAQSPPKAELLGTQRLGKWLRRHRDRPTVLASKSGFADVAPIVKDHAYPVVGLTQDTITVVNVLKESGEMDRTVTLPRGDIAKYFFLIVQGPEVYAERPSSPGIQKNGDID